MIDILYILFAIALMIIIIKFEIDESRNKSESIFVMKEIKDGYYTIAEEVINQDKNQY